MSKLCDLTPTVSSNRTDTVNRLAVCSSLAEKPFRYVTTTQKPADLATRGVSTEDRSCDQVALLGLSAD